MVPPQAFSKILLWIHLRWRPAAHRRLAFWWDGLFFSVGLGMTLFKKKISFNIIFNSNMKTIKRILITIHLILFGGLLFFISQSGSIIGVVGISFNIFLLLLILFLGLLNTFQVLRKGNWRAYSYIHLLGIGLPVLNLFLFLILVYWATWWFGSRVDRNFTRQWGENLHYLKRIRFRSWN